MTNMLLEIVAFQKICFRPSCCGNSFILHTGGSHLQGEMFSRLLRMFLFPPSRGLSLKSS